MHQPSWVLTLTTGEVSRAQNNPSGGMQPVQHAQGMGCSRCAQLLDQPVGALQARITLTASGLLHELDNQPACLFAVKVALWLVLKTADSKKQLVLPLSMFGLHLFLGNWWNGEHVSLPVNACSSCAASTAADLRRSCCKQRRWSRHAMLSGQAYYQLPLMHVLASSMSVCCTQHSSSPSTSLLCILRTAVVFFGWRKMEESVKWMGAFWTSIAGELLWCNRHLSTLRCRGSSLLCLHEPVHCSHIASPPAASTLTLHATDSASS